MIWSGIIAFVLATIVYFYIVPLLEFHFWSRYIIWTEAKVLSLIGIGYFILSIIEHQSFSNYLKHLMGEEKYNRKKGICIEINDLPKAPFIGANSIMIYYSIEKDEFWCANYTMKAGNFLGLLLEIQKKIQKLSQRYKKMKNRYEDGTRIEQILAETEQYIQENAIKIEEIIIAQKEAEKLS